MVLATLDMCQKVIEGLTVSYPSLRFFDLGRFLEEIHSAWTFFLEKSPVFPGGIIAHLRDEIAFPSVPDKLENHRKYLDIHLILEGCEELVWEKQSQENLLSEYNSEEDVEWYRFRSPYKNLIDSRLVAIIEPGWAHRTVSSSRGSAPIKKVVFKVPIDSNQ